jgi:hypothetical protein
VKAGICLFVVFMSALPALGSDRPDAAVLASAIDRRIGERLELLQITPAPLADDATFFRRINLALAGRIPEADQVRAFLADGSPDKRAKAIDRLLESPEFISYFTKSWRAWLLDDTNVNGDVVNGTADFEGWLAARLRAGTPFDMIVTELLTFPLDNRQMLAKSPDEIPANPLAFYITHEAKPENLAAATARVFLGVRLECAQCHNHPFARWKQDQFWGLAAFFAGVERSSGGGLRETLGRRELPIPNAERAAPATFLDDREPEWQYKKSPRVTLAAWLTAPENPFFAKATVNRLWWFLMGIGIVEPVDDFHDQNLASHPELLSDLAGAFIQSGFDTKFLLSAICRSETFGRSSAVADHRRMETRLFAHYPMQSLSPGQLFDSIGVITGKPAGKPSKDKVPQENPVRRQFLEAFAASGQPTATPTTILQALTLLNGDLISQAATNGKVATAVLTVSGQTAEQKVEALYLAALGRLPRPRELERAIRHVNAALTRGRYGDVLWALLNSLEFRTNH